MRLILEDRWSGGLVALLTAVFILLQAAFGAFADAATLLPSSDAMAIICHGDGAERVAPDPVRPGGDPAHHCPCGVFCGSGPLAPALPPALDLGAAYAPGGGVDLRFSRDAEAGRAPRPSGAPRFPTGPPLLSV
ncbi:hypothetical protein GCM10011390_30180 [Aureimonas endophytica]|uniref:DUF2946 domain-containing protein n=1 Tax=Aureimonas endophytica TaxID=2027858 RepID=A0A916ZRF1_9HYPH|nr:hypothetical protein [Aureimonas endophytica]GGE09056.1 hypothetical protein GCM10011390_30180 [Aureimonas endophytica]